MADQVYTFGELRDEVLSWLDEAGSNTATRTNVDNAINDSHRRRLTSQLWPFMIWDTPETFTLTAGTQLYTLHQEFHRPLYFFNRDKKQYLREVPARTLAPSGARWTTDRDNPRFTFWGRTPVQAQPSSASALSIASSSASDTTAAKAITILGVTSSGVDTESLTPNGTSTVTGSKSFSKILGVTKAAAWAGTMTLSAGVTTLLTLLPTEYGRSYQQMFLLGSPTSADTIEYRFYRLPRKLENTNDIPDIPPGHQQILVWDALLALGAYDNRLDGGRAPEWRDRQKAAETAFIAAFAEAQPVEADAQFIRDDEADADLAQGPTIWF